MALLALMALMPLPLPAALNVVEKPVNKYTDITPLASLPRRPSTRLLATGRQVLLATAALEQVPGLRNRAFLCSGLHCDGLSIGCGKQHRIAMVSQSTMARRSYAGVSSAPSWLMAFLDNFHHCVALSTSIRRSTQRTGRDCPARHDNFGHGHAVHGCRCRLPWINNQFFTSHDTLTTHISLLSARPASPILTYLDTRTSSVPFAISQQVHCTHNQHRTRENVVATHSELQSLTGIRLLT
jgi:hypothetical protein